jgi:restriction system protein
MSAVKEGESLPSTREELFRAASSRSPSDPFRLSIRELLQYWSAKRRGEVIVEEMKSDLSAARLTTIPSFTDGWIDTRISLVPMDAKFGDAGSSAPPEEETPTQPVQVALRVRSLESANAGVVWVRLDDNLERAQSLMMHHDYSQLAVVSGPRSLRGAISWESIAQAKIWNAQAALRDAIFPPEVVRLDDDLLAQIPKIADAGFVFVEALDRQISGIITTADLSMLFGTLAKPFFLLAEIERRLRRLVDANFGPEELAAVVDPTDDRTATRASDLTIGEYARLLEDPARWDRLGWNLDRRIFIEALHNIRLIRNDVMHFSPDPLDDEQIQKTELFLKWLRKLDPLP